MIPLKKPEMQGAKFSRHETYLSYVAVTGKLKQRRRLGFLGGIIPLFFIANCLIPGYTFGNAHPYLRNTNKVKKIIKESYLP